MKSSLLALVFTAISIGSSGMCNGTDSQGKIITGAELQKNATNPVKTPNQDPNASVKKENAVEIQGMDPANDPFLADLINNLNELVKEVKEPQARKSRSLELPTYLSHGNIDEAKAYARYAGAAYCSDSNIKAWSCSHCNSSKGVVEHLDTYFDKQTEAKGYLAMNRKKREIILAFRGSSTVKNFLQDAKFKKDPFKIKNQTFNVHRGFKQCSDALIKKYLPYLKTLLSQHSDFKLVITGHSLGGAISVLSALDIRAQLDLSDDRLKLYTFGEPRVGDDVFASYVNLQKFTSTRVVNGNDIVPHLPPQLTNFYHHHHEIWVNSDKHTNCTTTSLEHPKCSLSKWYWPSVSDHLKVWDIILGGTC